MFSADRIEFVFFLVVTLALVGCPKKIPQPEIDAAEASMVDIEDTKDCAPETYQAATTMMDRARALLKEERFEEAKTALLAARRLAEKAREECKQREKEQEQNQPESAEPEQAVREMDGELQDQGPDSLQTVRFGFNQSMLTDESRSVLADNAEYLRRRAGMRIQVEGHCDNRGSTEYNLALGERRAMAVKDYLVKLGIHPDRMEIISYGEERPVDSTQAEDAWALNRRAEFMPLR